MDKLMIIGDTFIIYPESINVFDDKIWFFGNIPVEVKETWIPICERKINSIEKDEWSGEYKKIINPEYEKELRSMWEWLVQKINNGDLIINLLTYSSIKVTI